MEEEWDKAALRWHQQHLSLPSFCLIVLEFASANY